MYLMEYVCVIRAPRELKHNQKMCHTLCIECPRKSGKKIHKATPGFSPALLQVDNSVSKTMIKSCILTKSIYNYLMLFNTISNFSRVERVREQEHQILFCSFNSIDPNLKTLFLCWKAPNGSNQKLQNLLSYH